ncbi:DUF3021 domain-containing protein [Sporosarcina limicola]|uniref:Membrane protein n=1 Tax=Sporosarcina limicola TaxID=34101 RepID=A0A927MK41_9BACL|nr:DUF3021 domain-containing protein [Sporosarcina limicola]MBE1553044.1 putative membrane protein [Sporosarcina limicola]
MKTFLIRSILGIFFGSFLAVLATYSAIYFGKNDVLNSQLFVEYSLRSIFSGWFFTVTPLFFENKKLSLSQQTALHFSTVIILYFIVAFGFSWIPFSIKNALFILGSFIVVYTLIWSAFYLHFRSEAKKLNADLDDF